MVRKKHHSDLKLTDERAYFRPFSYDWAFDAWLKHEQSHWTVGEIPMIEDVKDWKRRLSTEEKYFLTNIFRFFTQGDIDVAGGYVNNYLPLFPQPEIRMMLLGFAGREAVHIHAYSHLIETLGMPDSTYNEFLEYAAMKEKHEYVTAMSKGDSSQIAQQIGVFSAFTEGLQLFSSFVMLMNFPRHGKMRGMGQVISYSLIDETIHCESMIKLFRTYIEENPELWNDELKQSLYAIAEKMVELEDKFIDLAFSMGAMQNLTADDMKKYIRYIADRRLISMGLKGIFKVKKLPLLWVEEMINATQHTNFFENKAIAYGKGSLTGTWDEVWA
jgi:ribonucleoside-diphosphate reductase beta chain